ncbi:hypothetical protein G6F46_008312 [Rhizopus delemar]|uniref:Uncharacterized protein n=3 Tax=Rhizopus TaxID=4842 RepID=I1CFA9_RHIO9|nr:hypothetical protein RO3G_11850 [Rhizopus delemar RA 99-880]KAG1446636.1 hypothetical protein G6F55_011461 [Rhizopus delemar]KAG1534813.1 hypothetical protein G6F51_011882 [Rhizopus arrhizus]KAG1489352.1 hypothetical protein G6F54_011501 [Rhizopus delemar]KAG1508586.1 hypothetical protein G6F53_008085 [Rhizopus delemar]|eukprot:EIE87139.1 hypothetical protein RO3G_11850 [Rhizopus delemar RA 99-880]
MTDQNKTNDENQKDANKTIPSSKETSSLLSPWWSEASATRTAAEEAANNNTERENKYASILLGLSRNMEHNEDKELGWKEQCYLLANAPKMSYNSDRNSLEKLFDQSRECTMVCFLRESRKLARQRLLLAEEDKEEMSIRGSMLNLFHGIWISVAKTPKRCKEHILGEQSMMSKKDYPDYYTVDLEKEISRSGEHVTRIISKTFSPLQHLTQRYIESWKDGTQQRFFMSFWTRLERGDAFYLVRDYTKRLIDNALEDKKPSNKK